MSITDKEIEERYACLSEDPTFAQQKIHVADTEEIWAPIISKLASIPENIQAQATRLYELIPSNSHFVSDWIGYGFSITPWECGINHVYIDPTISVEDPRIKYVILAYRLAGCKNVEEIMETIEDIELGITSSFFWDIIETVNYHKDTRFLLKQRKMVEKLIKIIWP